MFGFEPLQLKRLPWLRSVSALTAAIKKAANEAGLDRIFEGRTLDAPISLKVVDHFDTACWAFTNPPKTHNIVIGTGIINRAKPGLSPEGLAGLVKAYDRHEAGHARRSPRTQEETEQRVLTPAGCTFATYNAFEDAALEHQDRAATHGEPFGWHTYEEFDVRTATSSPHNLFLTCIFVEGDRALLNNLLARCPTPPDLDEVWTFWERAAACPTPDDLVPVIRDWVQRFGDFERPPGGCGLAAGLAMGANPGLLQELVDYSDPERGEPDEDVGSSPVLRDREGGLPYEPEELDVVVDQLRRQLRSRELCLSTNKPTKRINHRAIAAERPLYRERRIEGTAHRKKIALMFDCSSSMDGSPYEAGVLFVAALSVLASEGLISGNVIFTKINNSSKAVSEAHALPLSDSILRRIVCDGGGEGLQQAATSHLPLLRAADWAGCYTDACIGGREINKSKLRSQGVYLHGMYVSAQMTDPNAKSQIMAKLRHHFHLAVAAPTVQRLLETLVIG